MANKHGVFTQSYAQAYYEHIYIDSGGIRRRVGRLSMPEGYVSARGYSIKINAGKKLAKCREVLDGQVFGDYDKAMSALISAFDEHYERGR